MHNLPKLFNDTYTAKITGFNKVITRAGNRMIKVDYLVLKSSKGVEVNTYLSEWIKLTDYDRLLRLKDSFYGLDYNDKDSIIGSYGILRYNSGHIGYVNIYELQRQLGINLEVEDEENVEN